MTENTKKSIGFYLIPALSLVLIIGYSIGFNYYLNSSLENCISRFESEGINFQLVCSRIDSTVSTAFFTITQALLLLVSLSITFSAILKSKISSLEKQIEELRINS